VVVIGKKVKHLSEAARCPVCWAIPSERCQRTQLQRPIAGVASQECRYLQADGTVDRDRRRPRQDGNHRESERQASNRFRTNDMIFGIKRSSSIDEIFHAVAGDVIWNGDRRRLARPEAGDVVEIEISRIGTLRKPVCRGESGREVVRHEPSLTAHHFPRRTGRPRVDTSLPIWVRSRLPVEELARWDQEGASIPK